MASLTLRKAAAPCAVLIGACLPSSAFADDAGMHALWRSEAARVRPASIERQPSAPEQGALNIRVRTRSIRHEEARRHRSAPPPSWLAAQKQAYADLNPATHPDWYLNDPTLKKGDLVVLPDRVLVYDGGRREVKTASDFTDLRDASSLPRATRTLIQKAASL